MNFRKAIYSISKYDYIFIAIIFLFILLRFYDLSLPFFGDEVGFYVKAVYYMQHHIISLLPGDIPGDYSRGHPLLFLFIYSTISKLSGFYVYLLHTISLFISIATLWATYLFSKKLFTPIIALATVVLVMVQPVYLAQSLMVLPEMMLTFFVTLSICYYTEKKVVLYFIACSLALLTKESAVILPLALFSGDYIYGCIKDRKILLGKCISYLWALYPLSVFITFFIIQRIQVGWFFFPIHVDLVSFYYKDIAWRIIQAVHFLFIKQGRILWLIIIGLFMIKFIKNIYHHKALPSDYRNVSIFILFILGVIAFSSLNFSLHRYLLYAIPALCIFTVYCLNTVLNNKILLVVAFFILCTVSIYFAKSNSLMYDENLSFKEMVSVNKKAIAYMEDHQLFNDVIVANSPVCEEMSDTCMGYLRYKNFTKAYLTNDIKSVSKNNKIDWCIINDPEIFDFNILPFKVKKEIIFTSSFASTGIYKVVP